VREVVCGFPALRRMEACGVGFSTPQHCNSPKAVKLQGRAQCKYEGKELEFSGVLCYSITLRTGSTEEKTPQGGTECKYF